MSHPTQSLNQCESQAKPAGIHHEGMPQARQSTKPVDSPQKTALKSSMYQPELAATQPGSDQDSQAAIKADSLTIRHELASVPHSKLASRHAEVEIRTKQGIHSLKKTPSK